MIQRSSSACLLHPRITCAHLPFRSKWLYVGTERGNVHVVNIESFILSGYVINWNKAIELSRKTHPGQVIHLSDNPADPNKVNALRLGLFPLFVDAIFSAASYWL